MLRIIPLRMAEIGAVLFIAATACAQDRHWELSPYRIQIKVAADNSLQSENGVSAALMEYLESRIQSTMFPVWDAELLLSGSAQQSTMQLATLEEKELPESALQYDKLFYLSVTESLAGYKIACREFDTLLWRWSPVIERRVSQRRSLPEQCFQLLQEVFSPLAQVELIAEDNEHVMLSMKGSKLPRLADDATFIDAHSIFQPRMVRAGTLAERSPENVREIPWTYLAAQAPTEKGWRAKIYSGTLRPFGLRKRGQIEYVALGLPPRDSATKVRFYARHHESQGLAGYEVFIRPAGADSTKPFGLTDSAGSVEVAGREHGIVELFLRSDGQLLAKVPIAVGAEANLEVPVADDVARLRAQAALTEFREELIDLVARRNILIARVRNRLDEGDISTARQLFAELDDLPGRARFDNRLRQLEENPANQSSDQKIQRRIEQMIADTRQLLGRFLGTQEVSQLQNELLAARRQADN